MNVSESNHFMKELISQDKPFIVSRMGLGAESVLSFLLFFNKSTSIETLNRFIHVLSNNAGIYNSENNLNEFVKLYVFAIQNSKALATFRDINIANIDTIQSSFIKRFKLKNTIHSRCLEPFYHLLENEIPWSHSLLGKKVLIIHPFIDSMKKQINNKFQIFKDKKLFLDNQEFLFYKTYQTQAGNHIHSSWRETYDLMCSDIEKIDFDIALLGCGGYGLPLCSFIYSKLNKSAIYVGGGLQLLFGVMGKRWENNNLWKKIISENNTKFIRPSGDEIIKNTYRVENSCYW